MVLAPFFIGLSLGLACFHWSVLFFIGVAIGWLVFAILLYLLFMVLSMVLAPFFFVLSCFFINLSIALACFHCFVLFALVLLLCWCYCVGLVSLVLSRVWAWFSLFRLGPRLYHKGPSLSKNLVFKAIARLYQRDACLAIGVLV